MNSNPKSLSDWLHAATSGLDRTVRERLELELTAHYEDAYQDLVTSGLTPEEASRIALENLGDADAAQKLFQEQYAAEMPWERDFLPTKLQDAEYGYLKGNKMISCSREELIEVCSGAGINSTEVTLAWTPETERVVPVETIPFLFEAIKKKRIKSAKWELANSAVWGGLILGPFSRDFSSNFRHLLLFFSLLIVIPGLNGWRSLRAAQTLTPETLAKEFTKSEKEFVIWSGLQTAHLTLSLVILCSVVAVVEIFAIGFNGSIENAALVKPVTFSGEWYRLLTCVFVHAGFPHLLANAIGLGVFGHLVEIVIGKWFTPIVFLFSALSGSLFSLFLNPENSVGASGGVLGLVGFLFFTAAQTKAGPLADVRQTAAFVALFSAICGIIAYDLFDSAAHLGGLLVGMTMGWLVKDPKKIDANRTFQCVGVGACLVLLAGAVLAIYLMMYHLPKTSVNRAQEVNSEALVAFILQ